MAARFNAVCRYVHGMQLCAAQRWLLLRAWHVAPRLAPNPARRTAGCCCMSGTQPCAAHCWLLLRFGHATLCGASLVAAAVQPARSSVRRIAGLCTQPTRSSVRRVLAAATQPEHTSACHVDGCKCAAVCCRSPALPVACCALCGRHALLCSALSSNVSKALAQLLWAFGDVGSSVAARTTLQRSLQGSDAEGGPARGESAGGHRRGRGSFHAQ
jgi:hypothetical protein